MHVLPRSQYHPSGVCGLRANGGGLHQIIHKTFTPLLRHGQTLPPGLAPALLHRFSSKDGYETEPQTLAALRALRDDQRDATRRTRFEKIVVGVITNSDDRVPDILSSLSVDVSPLRYGAAAASLPSRQPHDVDFHCMSFDVGVEKPDPRIFRAAEAMLSQIIAAREGRNAEDSAAEAQTWEKLYVGDEYAKDVVGARNAGWKAALLAGDDSQEAADDAPVLDDHPDASSFHGLFSQHDFVAVRSIQNLVDWVRSEEGVGYPA